MVSKATDRCAPPRSRATEGGAIAGQSAERRGRAHGAAGVSADGGYRRTLLHARHRSTGRPAGECARIAWLHAIANSAFSP